MRRGGIPPPNPFHAYIFYARKAAPRSLQRDVPRAGTRRTGQRVFHISMEKDINEIIFSNVELKYDDFTALKDINLEIPPGQTLAILGKTGSGKTTLVNLILRIYDVTKGKITLDDVDIRDLTLKNLRENIAYAPQDNFLFSKTICFV